MNKLLIIDGSSILFRAYYALPPMNTRDGKHTNAVLGFTNILLSSIELIEPTHIAVCFDLSAPTFRHEMYGDYKGTRMKAPEDLSEQFDYVKEVLTGFGIKYYEIPGFEADDIAGTISTRANEAGVDTYLLTGDRDYMQLVDSNTELLLTKKGVSDLKIYKTEDILEEYGIEPKQFIDLKALMGDKSDNIPGVPGVGEKTALKLIKEYGNLENLYENVGGLKTSKVNQNIIENRDLAFISRDLATIDTNVDVDVKLEDLYYDRNYGDVLAESLSKFELKTVLNRLNLSAVEENTIDTKNVEIVYDASIAEIEKSITKDEILVFKILTDGKIYNGYAPLYIGFYCNDKIYLNRLEMGNLSPYKNILENPESKKVSYDLKEDIIIISSQGIDLENIVGDIKVAEYLLNPIDNNYSISRLGFKYGINIDPEFERLEKDKKLVLENLSTEEIGIYISTLLQTAFVAHGSQLNELEEKNLYNLYMDMELPLVRVLADMELEGVHVDREALEEIGKELSFELENIQREIYTLAGEEFNINSPKQLGAILFEKLALPVVKKTKTGYSTDIDVLESLEDKHEIISYIIRQRTLSKLIGTYVEGLARYINPLTGRIHSNFSQTVAATGRLSSTDPNLQNIPVKTEEGRLFRKIFIAKDKGHKFVDADYSQIELRLLADISNDVEMINAFTNQEDIHRSTAAKVFEVPMEDVTSLMRSRAKAVNFGIVYGISDFGLSQDLKISRKEAKIYIDNYLEKYSGISKYMEEIVKTAKENGYVETKFHRRRDLPELDSRNVNIRKFGERIALNMPIQGTAADIIKIAMIDVFNALKEKNLKAKLILQVHDELIIEAPVDEVNEVMTILSEKMQGAASLRIPLVVDMNVGDSWYETK